MAQEPFALTQWPALAARGERGALDRAFATSYPELRRLAHARLRVQGGDTALDATTLVHETFLRLAGAPGLALADRRHFFAYAAKTMRHIIIDAARERLAERHGGGAAPRSLDAEPAGDVADDDGRAATFLRINDALLALEAADAELARLVEMRYFAGYGEAEVAALLGTSERTVRRQWKKARDFLRVCLRG